MVEVIRRRRRKLQLTVNLSDCVNHSGAVTEDVRGRVVVVRAESAPKVDPVGARVSEQHVVSDRDNVKPSIGGNPWW